MTVGPLPSVARSEKELHVHAIADGGILEVIWSNRTSTTMYFTPLNFNASISFFGGGSAVEAVVLQPVTRRTERQYFVKLRCYSYAPPPLPLAPSVGRPGTIRCHHPFYGCVGCPLLIRGLPTPHHPVPPSVRALLNFPWHHLWLHAH